MLGPKNNKHQYPASSLQPSFERSDDHQELFLARRLTAADVHHSHAGLCTLRLGVEHVPKYALKRRHHGDGGGDREQQAQAEAAAAPHVLVKLHAWKGDRHLGVWHVGQLRGDAAYEVVD